MPQPPFWQPMAEIIALISKINKIPENHIVDWVNERNSKLSPEKPTSAIFATQTKEQEVGINIFIEINGDMLPTVNNPKVHGVAFDPLYQKWPTRGSRTACGSSIVILWLNSTAYISTTLEKSVPD